ncbi:hypothetical protein FA743_09455 [Paracoccus gahaiensis]|uniref:Uncharacterized protein n=1 Tax=Paracoccus gahaiensis TaxID=1706839 RepID=A0A4U0R9Z4_9RHOB|nr:hypothetical protein [Paracoccus gahaiensis]TJZ92031.1 hypothetical protein FA743_09455 [Paracoccus gahaiensis]
MARHLMQTNTAALLAVALAGPAWAQGTAAPSEAPLDRGQAEQELGGGAGAAGSVVGGDGAQPVENEGAARVDPPEAELPDAGAEMPEAGTEADAGAEMQSGTEMETEGDADTTGGMAPEGAEGTQPTITGSGQNTGSAEDSGGSAEPDALTRTRLAEDLREGQIGQDVVETLDTTTRLQILPLSEVDETGGASMATAEESNPPMTGGRTTNETVEDSGGAPGAASGTAAQASGSPAGISEGLATGSTQTAGTSMGTRGDLDTAMEEAGDSRQALQAAMQQNPRIVEALEAEDRAPEDVIAVYATENGVEIIVDDRSE